MKVTAEKVQREIIGVVLMVSALMNWAWVVFFLGAMLFISAIISWCPMIFILDIMGIRQVVIPKKIALERLFRGIAGILIVIGMIPISLGNPVWFWIPGIIGVILPLL